MRLCNTHCVKNVSIRSFTGPHFPAFGLNKERMRALMRENTDIKTLNIDTLYAATSKDLFVRFFEFDLPYIQFFFACQI